MEIAAITVLLEVVSKTMDKFPDYDQKKKSEFFDMVKEFEEEKKKIYPDRDDDKIMNLRESLVNFSKIYASEISQGKPK